MTPKSSKQKSTMSFQGQFRRRMVSFVPSGLAVKLASVLSVGLLSGLSVLSLQASATDLPVGVLSYLRQKTPAVNIRFDGLVTFPNGERYVPVIPQENVNPDPKSVLATLPAKASYPDLVEFDNHFYLLRLIETQSGRLTFAKMDTYPIQLREGLLPQDLVLPSNLFIPLELKVILGALPYNPTFTPTTTPATPAKTATSATQPAKFTASTTPQKTGQVTVGTKSPSEIPREITSLRSTAPGFIFDIGSQQLYAIDPLTGRKKADVPLNCAPSGLTLSPDGHLLFAPCLSTNELAVVDVEANLVKNRIPMGERPSHALYLPAGTHQLQSTLEQLQDSQSAAKDADKSDKESKLPNLPVAPGSVTPRPARVLVSNLYSPFLAVVDAGTLLPEEKITLPANGGVMAHFPAYTPVAVNTMDGRKPPALQPLPDMVAIANVTANQIYILNLDKRTVDKTFPAIPDMSSIAVMPNLEGRPEIWAVSRTQDKLLVMDGLSGGELYQVQLGRKPVAMLPHGDMVYILCAGDASVYRVNRKSHGSQKIATLEENSFPSAMSIPPGSGRAYITGAASDKIFVINLNTGNLETTIPVDFRSSLLAFPPDMDQLNGAPQLSRPSAAGVHFTNNALSPESINQTPSSGAAIAPVKMPTIDPTPAAHYQKAPTDTKKPAAANPVATPSVKKPFPGLTPIKLTKPAPNNGQINKTEMTPSGDASAKSSTQPSTTQDAAKDAPQVMMAPASADEQESVHIELKPAPEPASGTNSSKSAAPVAMPVPIGEHPNERVYSSGKTESLKQEKMSQENAPAKDKPPVTPPAFGVATPENDKQATSDLNTSDTTEKKSFFKRKAKNVAPVKNEKANDSTSKTKESASEPVKPLAMPEPLK